MIIPSITMHYSIEVYCLDVLDNAYLESNCDFQ